MIYGTRAKTEVVTYYCHSITCREFGRGQELRYLTASWDGPSEWVDDPECQGCGGDLQEEYPDFEVEI